MNTQHQDLIDSYLRGEMPAEERADFERRVEADAELKEQLEFTATVRQELGSRAEKLRQMRRWDAAERRKRRLGYVAAAALGAAAMAVFGFFINYSALAPNVPSAGVEMQLPPLDRERLESYRNGDNLQHIADMIERNQYGDALTLIEQEEAALQGDAEAAAPDDAEAPAEEETAEDRERKEYERQAAALDADELRWLKVYALVGLDRKDEAMRLLNDICKDKGKYYQKAEQLIGK